MTHHDTLLFVHRGWAVVRVPQTTATGYGGTHQTTTARHHAAIAKFNPSVTNYLDRLGKARKG
jgi:hypothetical protein